MLETPAPALGAAAGSAKKPRSAGAFRRLGELLALTAFAIAQPVLDVTGRAPDFFLYRRANTNEMRLFVLLVVLLPPLVLWAVEVVVGLVSKVAARAVHLVFVAMLFALLLVQVGKKAGPVTGIPLAVLAALAGGALAVLLMRKNGFRQAVLYATPAPVIFALLFTMTSPSGALVRGTEVDRGPGRYVANRPPIVFLFLDEFPLRALLDGKGAIDANLFPNFARLQRMSNWYPNATGNTGWTPFAAPAMLRGAHPSKAQAASYINYPETMFTLLAGSYRMRAYETISDLCPPGLCVSVADGRGVGMRALAKDTVGLTGDLVSPYPTKENVTEQFVENAVEGARQAAEGKEKPRAQSKFNTIGYNQPNRFTAFLTDLKPMPAPNLHFLHLLLPHAPYRYLPSGKLYPQPPHVWPPEPPDPTRPKGVSREDPMWSVMLKQRLVLQTMYTDTLIGALLNRMEATGLLDQALLVVTADHGTGIEPRTKLRQLDDRNAADIAWVPTFVKTPGQQVGKVDRRNAQSVDLLPTIADVLDVAIPWRIDGVSLLGPARTSAEKFWTDNPNGKGRRIDPEPWLPKVAKGYASEVADPELGARGVFKVGPLGHLVGRKVSDFTIGSRSPVTAKLYEQVDVSAPVDPESGELPAAIFGDLDRPAGPEPGWLLAGVNGTIAGAVAAMPGDGTWRFFGMLDESLFRAGRNTVTLYAVDGTTLHELTLAR